MRRARSLVLVGVLSILAAPPSFPSAPAGDAEVDKGVALVAAGEYAQAILVLDGAARRLGADPGHKALAVQAYLNLGIACLGDAQETQARAAFREALVRDPALQLSAFDASPRVREVFQQAKDALALERASAKKGGSTAKPVLITLGVLGAGGAAVVGLAPKHDKSSQGSSSTGGVCPPVDVTLTSVDPPSGSTVTMGQRTVNFRFTVSSLQAQSPGIRLWMDTASGKDCYLAQVALPASNCGTVTQNVPVPIDGSARSLGCVPPFTITAVRYQVDPNGRANSAPYTLTVVD